MELVIMFFLYLPTFLLVIPLISSIWVMAESKTYQDLHNFFSASKLAKNQTKLLFT